MKSHRRTQLEIAVRGFAASLGLMLCACQSAGGPSLADMGATINATFEVSTDVLGPGDQVEVRFSSSPDWNQEVAVAPDGSASFQAVGTLKVAGMTPAALTQALRSAYANVLEYPDVVVAIVEPGERKVYVMGEVGTPGELVLGADRRITLLDAIARAGGPLKQSAYLAHTVLIRWSAAKGQQISWTIDAREDNWMGAEPVYLQPYDLIYIPNTPIDDVGIWVDNYIRRLIPFPYLVGGT